MMSHKLEMLLQRYKKRLSPRIDAGGEPLLYKGGDAPKSNFRWFFGVVNSLGGLCYLHSQGKGAGAGEQKRG